MKTHPELRASRIHQLPSSPISPEPGADFLGADKHANKALARCLGSGCLARMMASAEKTIVTGEPARLCAGIVLARLMSESTPPAVQRAFGQLVDQCPGGHVAAIAQVVTPERWAQDYSVIDVALRQPATDNMDNELMVA